jgi:inner membrane protease subunit 1
MSHLRSILLSSLRCTRKVGSVHRPHRFTIHQARTGTAGTRTRTSSSSSGNKANVEDNSIDLGLTLHLWRLACAFGMVYVTTEYGFELTICEGPSMLPTINSYGEIIMIDRLTPRLYGIQGGPDGEKRASLAREKQKKHEELILATSRKYSKENMTWHEPMIPTNKLPPDGRWNRLFSHLKTGVSVGDVVVVQHPDRVGTVCKRVLGLPGDVVTKPRMRDRREKQRLRRRRTGMVKIPDGHIWVEGDNPWNSSDSRNYGPVPASLIVGRVLMRVWPLGNFLMGLERGARPERSEADQPRMSFSGSVVLPAGYENQVVLRQHEISS